MRLINTKKALQRFAKHVVSQSRANLTRAKKNRGKLYSSLEGKVKVSPNSFSLKLLMEDYGAYQDEGVRGKDPSKVSPNAKIRGQQAPSSRFKFGSGKVGRYADFVSSIKKWAQTRNIRLRDKKGKFTKGNYTTIAHIIAGNIYNRGIKPSLFFTKPFRSAFKNLPEELIEAYGLDIDEFLKFTTK